MNVTESTRLSRLLDEAWQQESKLRAEIVRKATSDPTFVLGARRWANSGGRPVPKRREAEVAPLEFEPRGGNSA